MLIFMSWLIQQIVEYPFISLLILMVLVLLIGLAVRSQIIQFRVRRLSNQQFLSQLKQHLSPHSSPKKKS